jgi:hypothetical protein
MNQAWFQYKILPPKAAKDFLPNLHTNLIWREAPKNDFWHNPGSTLS